MGARRVLYYPGSDWRGSGDSCDKRVVDVVVVVGLAGVSSEATVGDIGAGIGYVFCVVAAAYTVVPDLPA